MNDQPCPWPAAVALALGLVLSGCTIGEPASGDTPSTVDRTKDQTRHRHKDRKKRVQQKARKRTKASPTPAPKPIWVCSWSPTFDDDWHNDVECSNGIATERPYLRTDDDFVERREIMQSARAYARERNAG